MGPIGKNSDLVNLIHAKTKIKKTEISDLLKVLPECMAESFFMSNIEAETTFDSAGIAITWHSTPGRGSWITFKPSYLLKTHLFRLKKEKKHPLAVTLSK